ncbi:MAG: flagellar protein FlgN [Candidatus Zixiibacteriota bacterium]
MSLAAVCNVLGSVLREEQECASRLLAVLETEHAAIARRDTDALQQAVDEKQILLAQLETSHGRRLQLLQQEGIEAAPQGFEALLAQCAVGHKELNDLWVRTKAVLESCQRQNQINGAVLESSRRITHRALSILLGGQAEGSELYNQSGKATTSPFGGNRVIKA